MTSKFLSLTTERNKHWVQPARASAQLVIRTRVHSIAKVVLAGNRKCWSKRSGICFASNPPCVVLYNQSALLQNWRGICPSRTPTKGLLNNFTVSFLCPVNRWVLPLCAVVPIDHVLSKWGICKDFMSAPSCFAQLRQIETKVLSAKQISLSHFCYFPDISEMFLLLHLLPIVIVPVSLTAKCPYEMLMEIVAFHDKLRQKAMEGLLRSTHGKLFFFLSPPSLSLSVSLSLSLTHTHKHTQTHTRTHAHTKRKHTDINAAQQLTFLHCVFSLVDWSNFPQWQDTCTWGSHFWMISLLPVVSTFRGKKNKKVVDMYECNKLLCLGVVQLYLKCSCFRKICGLLWTVVFHTPWSLADAFFWSTSGPNIHQTNDHWCVQKKFRNIESTKTAESFYHWCSCGIPPAPTLASACVLFRTFLNHRWGNQYAKRLFFLQLDFLINVHLFSISSTCMQ